MKFTSFSFLLLLFSWAGHVHALNEWEKLNQKTELLYQQGNYSAAVDAALQALQIAEQTFDPDHADLATSLNSLGMLYSAQGRYAQAEPLLSRALGIFEKSAGEESPEMAATARSG